MAVERTGQCSRLALGRLECGVVFVLDLAQYLLDDVLDGDDAGGPAVLVDHHRHRATRPLELDQKGVEVHRLGDHLGGRGEGRHRHPVALVDRHGEGVLDEGDADDGVQVALVDREAGVSGLHRQATQVVHGGVGGKTVH